MATQMTMNQTKVGTDNAKRGPSYAINLLGWLVHTIRTMNKPHADDASALSAFLANCEGVKIRLERMVKDEKTSGAVDTPTVHSLASVKPVAPSVIATPKPDAISKPTAPKLTCKVCGSAVAGPDELVSGACVDCLYADEPTAPAPVKPTVKAAQTAQNKPETIKAVPAPVKPVASAESELDALRKQAKALGIRGYALPAIKPDTLRRMIAEKTGKVIGHVDLSGGEVSIVINQPTAKKAPSHKPVAPLNAQGEEMDAKQIKADILARWGRGYAKAGMNRSELAAVHARLSRIDDEKRAAAEKARQEEEARKASEEKDEEPTAPTLDSAETSALLLELAKRIGAKRGPGSKSKKEEARALLSKLGALLS